MVGVGMGESPTFPLRKKKREVYLVGLEFVSSMPSWDRLGRIPLRSAWQNRPFALQRNKTRTQRARNLGFGLLCLHGACGTLLDMCVRVLPHSTVTSCHVFFLLLLVACSLIQRKKKKAFRLNSQLPKWDFGQRCGAFSSHAL